jgi:hypothetical protein
LLPHDRADDLATEKQAFKSGVDHQIPFAFRNLPGWFRNGESGIITRISTLPNFSNENPEIFDLLTLPTSGRRSPAAADFFNLAFHYFQLSSRLLQTTISTPLSQSQGQPFADSSLAPVTTATLSAS